ncbi:MAG: Transglutaminase-like superfamily protein [Candidatus Hydrogenedentes bacterium ADurb.Bin170]|nr:MAG: Transglutaminase-like superfamily protein [Candidatus Hydrogenedentes bacterium ADurb.Bin170]
MASSYQRNLSTHAEAVRANLSSSDPLNDASVNRDGVPQPFFSSSIHTEQSWPLLDGADGTFQALALMAAAVRGECPPDYSGYSDPYIRAAAARIITAYGKGYSAEAALQALFSFCRDAIAYLDHPWNVQQVQDARRTLERMTGDCVSKSVCLTTLLATQGIISRFVAQAPTGNEFNHVYVEALTAQGWIGLDPVASGTMGRPFGEIGWRQALPDYGFETSSEIFHG